MSSLKLGGHRGMGCTDHDFYQNLRDIPNLSVENTLESIAQAFEQGADYIETDAVMSKDGVLFTIHNVVPKDHFFGTEFPPALLNTLNFADIEKYRTGRGNNGKIARMSDVLNYIAAIDPKTLPWAINIEIKGVQGSGQNYENNDYLKNLTQTVKESGLPENRILWSSFSLENILRISHAFPISHYGMLFGEKPEARGIYADYTNNPHYQYLPFDTGSIQLVTQEWKSHANPKTRLGYMHPEITTVSLHQINLMKEKNLGINAWALFEQFDANRAAHYRQMTAHAQVQDVPFTIITDYLPEMQKLGI